MTARNGLLLFGLVAGAALAFRSFSPAGAGSDVAPEPRRSDAALSSPAMQDAKPASAVAPAGETKRAFDDERGRGEWMLRTLEQAFASEARDDPWADETEAALRSPDTVDVQGIESVDAACRSTICRVRVGFEGGPSLGAMQRLLARPALATNGYHGIDPEDPERIRVYVSRGDTNLAEHPHLVAAANAL